MKWTESQKAAIDSRNSNLLVSAAAGSGKTAVMVQRIINLITEEKIDIDRMLVVTFTNAAASGMREKISRELAKSDDPWVRRQRGKIGHASIKTIDSFCNDIVKQYYYVAELDPGLRTARGEEAKLLMQKSLEEVFEKGYENFENGDDTLERVADVFDTDINDFLTREKVQKLYEFIRCQPEPGKWLDDRIADYSVDAEGFDTTPWGKMLMRIAGIYLDSAIDALTEAIEKANECGLIGVAGILGKDLEQARLLKTYGTCPELEKAIASIGFPTMRKDKGASADVAYAFIKQVRDSAKQEIQKLRGFFNTSIDDTVTRLNEMKPVAEGLASLVRSLDEVYTRNKLEKGVMDFGDMEHYALKILGDDTVAQEIREHFDYIFVDEYQDSNTLQESIINRIRREDNLFFVGDVKQSIYRFRMAQPELFIEKMNTFNGGKNRSVYLNNNFRSAKGILDATNFVFRNIMTRNAGEVDYDENAQLNPAESGWQHDKPSSAECIATPVEMNFLIEGVEGNEFEGGVAQEAERAAQRMLELHGKMIFDPELGEMRPAGWRDMVILMAVVKSNGDIVKNVLEQYGIPVFTSDRTGFFEDHEIGVILSLLNVINNRRRDVHMLTVMRSVIGGFNEQDFADIRLYSQEKCFYDAMKKYTEDKDDELSERLKQFDEKIERWAFASRFTPLDRLIAQITDESGFVDYISCLPGGIQKKANIKVLMDKAVQFEATGMRGVYSFIRFAENLKKHDTDMSSAKILSDADDVVRVMTIHASKGLEFPLVFILNLGKQSGTQNGEEWLHKELGISIDHIDPVNNVKRGMLTKKIAGEVTRMEEKAEKMRLLYVAMTRAVNGLYMFGTKKVAKRGNKWLLTPTPTAVLNASSDLDWLGMLLMRHKDGKAMREMFIPAMVNDWEKIEDDSDWKVNIFTSAAQSPQRNQDGICVPEGREYGDKDFAEGIIDKLKWEYPYTEDTIMPSKVSVTAIKSEGEPPAAQLIRKPVAYAEEHPLTGAEKGTVVHRLLSMMELGKMSDEAACREQIAQLTEKGVISAKEAEAVDIKYLTRFADSLLGRRIIASSPMRETPFCIKLPMQQFTDKYGDREILVQGIIDCWFVSDDGIVLVDYKTDYVASEPEAVAEKYRMQLNIYAYALETITGKQVTEKYIFLLRTSETVKM